MRIHFLQHVSFEGPAAIADWAKEAGHTLSGTHLYRGDALPTVVDFDFLVIMGGPMSVNDERVFPWLAAEKQLVRAAVAAGRGVLGVCLGAQMIASAMGAPVYRAAEKEIGWFPVRRVTASGVGAVLPEGFAPLHWHGETFDLPAGAVRLAATDVVPNQAFAIGDRVVGLQFHLEATPESVRELVAGAGDEIRPGERFQQAASDIVAAAAHASAAVRPVLWALMGYLSKA